MPYRECCSSNIHVYLQPQDVPVWKPNDYCLCKEKKEHRETQGGGRQGEDRSRGCSMHSAEERLRLARPTEGGRCRESFFPRKFRREHSPASTLISDFRPPESRRNKFQLFPSHPGLPSWLWQPHSNSSTHFPSLPLVPSTGPTLTRGQLDKSSWEIICRSVLCRSREKRWI